jgi:activating signal cointegrator 1
MSKKKTKGERLDLSDRGVVLLKGRRECLCQAQYHNLVNNCLTCGKIICEQEGEGPCFFCGNIVLYPEKLGENRDLFEKLQNEETIFDLEYKKAKEHQDKLVSYDRNSQSQSNIYDEQVP